MNVVPVINSGGAFPDFGSSKKVLVEAKRIGWFAKYSAVLPKDRKKPLDKIDEVFNSVLKMVAAAVISKSDEKIADSDIPTPDSISGYVRMKLGFAPHVRQLFLNQLGDVVSLERIEKVAKRFLSSRSFIDTSPLIRTSRGLKGVTFLVNYPMAQDQGVVQRSYVVKWTHELEYPTNQIYAAFENIFRTEKIDHSFYYVPAFVGLDFEKRVHLLASGETLDIEDPEVLQKTLNEIPSSCKEEPKDKFILLSQMVNGENLFDFIESKYQDLSPEQKRSMFKQWARLQCFDLVVGNTDRFIPVIFDLGNFVVSGSANLGNGMMVWSKDKEMAPLLYAIDNVFDPDILSDPELGPKYCQFLDHIFSQRDFAKALSEMMIHSIKEFFKNDSEDKSPERKAIHEHFLKDLASCGKYFESGFTEMAVWLRDRLIPRWGSNEYNPLRDAMNKANPVFMKAIDAQLRVFMKAMNPGLMGLSGPVKI